MTEKQLHFRGHLGQLCLYNNFIIFLVLIASNFAPVACFKPYQMCGGNKRFATASLFSSYVLSNTFWNLTKNDYVYKAKSNWDNTNFCYKLLVIIIERLES